MKYVKMLGLLAVAAAALMAFAGTASATILTSPAGTTYTGSIAAEAGTTTLHGSFTSVSCNKSTVEGKVEKHGTGITVSGKVSKLTFSECNYPVTVKNGGRLEVHGTSTTNNGTLTSNEAEVAIHTSIGECVFTTNSTHIGTVTGGSPAVFNISGNIPRTGGSFFCGSSGQWTGSYTVKTPATLLIH